MKRRREKVKRVLKDLCLESYSENSSFVMDGEELEKQCEKAGTTMEIVEGCGLIVANIDGETWQMIHFTFQEFFVSVKICESMEARSSKKKKSEEEEEEHQQVLHWWNQHWKEKMRDAVWRFVVSRLLWSKEMEDERRRKGNERDLGRDEEGTNGKSVQNPSDSSTCLLFRGNEEEEREGR